LALCNKILVVLVFLIVLPVQAEISEEVLPAFSLRYDPTRDPFMDGKQAIDLAQASGRNILIEVGGDWCSWCHVLDRFFRSDPVIWNRLHEGFVLLKVNVSNANNNARFMAGLPPIKGYPHLYVARSNGSLIHSQDASEFISDGQYSADEFLVFLDHWSKVGHESKTQTTR